MNVMYPPYPSITPDKNVVISVSCTGHSPASSARVLELMRLKTHAMLRNTSCSNRLSFTSTFLYASNRRSVSSIRYYGIKVNAILVNEPYGRNQCESSADPTKMICIHMPHLKSLV